MKKRTRKQIAVRSIGIPDFELAAVLLAPLMLKIHKRNSKSEARIHIGGRTHGRQT